jgi:hypothetical protein
MLLHAVQEKGPQPHRVGADLGSDKKMTELHTYPSLVIGLACDFKILNE